MALEYRHNYTLYAADFTAKDAIARIGVGHGGTPSGGQKPLLTTRPIHLYRGYEVLHPGRLSVWLSCTCDLFGFGFGFTDLYAKSENRRKLKFIGDILMRDHE